MKFVRQLAASHNWHAMQALPHPHLSSPTQTGTQDEYLETTSLLLGSSNSRSKLEVLFHWNDITVSLGSCSARTPPAAGGAVASVGSLGLQSTGASDEKWGNKILPLQDIAGSNCREKFISLFTNSY